MLSPNSEASLLTADLSEPRGKVLKHHGSKLNNSVQKMNTSCPLSLSQEPEVGVAAIKGL